MTSNHAFTSPRLRRLFCSLFFVAAAIAALGAFGSSRASSQGSPPEQAATATKIAPWVMEHTANGQQAEFFVVLADQADLSGAAALPTKNEKGRYVYDALWNKSQATQGPILQWLRERGIEHHSFYIVNAILVKGSREIAETLAARPDVARVEGNPQIQNSLPQPGPRLMRLRSLRLRRRSNRESLTRMRLTSGRSDSPGRILWWRAPILVFAGRITRLNLTTAAGME